MKILGIETSCDETAVCIVEAQGDVENVSFNVLGDALYSQTKIHSKYGGVFPSLAKREHAKNLVPLLRKVLSEVRGEDLTDLGPSERVVVPLGLDPSKVGERGKDLPLAALREILNREPGLFEALKELLNEIEKPDIDAIAVTMGPGLEPALWVGINFAKALHTAWSIPVIPINHMEGHILSPLLSKDAQKVHFPALALLISGGHTELVLMKDWLEYEIIGQTRDDAVGEAFDKVARLLGLPYPGGPEISKLAAEARKEKIKSEIKLPRPMINTPDFDFSFSGIKTAVLYSLKKLSEITPEVKKRYALEFENAVTEVLVEKTRKALEKYQAKTLILGGGVIANTHIRNEFKKLTENFPEINLLIPELKLSTDNAVMIAIAGYLNHIIGKKPNENIVAEGNLKL